MSKQRGFAAIGLVNPKTNLNVGMATRAAGCYNASMVAIQGKRFHEAKTDPASSWRHFPLIQTDDIMSVIPFDCIPVAVEFIKEAIPLQTYVHPERAYYIFGPEDGSIPNAIMQKCRDVIYVPTNQCMNLAATVNVILYDRLAKQLTRKK